MSLGSKVFVGSVWAILDRFGTMAIQFFVNLILARLLTPSDYGCIGMLSIFIMVSQVLIDGGFGSALIQKKEPTQVDYSTIFYWNLLLSFFLYIILFFTAPSIAAFFNMPLLDNVLKVLGCILIINSFSIIQNNRMRKQLAFNTIAKVNVVSLLLASGVAVFLAYHGFGVWSLVVMQLLNAFFIALFLWFATRWRPSFCFSVLSLKKLFGFGGYLLISNILQEICRNIQGLIIGRKFSAAEMGLYSQARKLDDVVSMTLPNIIVQVMFPVYSQIQNDLERTREIVRMMVRIISFAIFPLMILLILFAEPIILFLYGNKWEASIPYFQILCVGGLFVCLQNVNYYAVAAQGKSRALLLWSFYKWGMLFVFLIIGMHWGMNGILWGMVVSSLNIYLVNAGLVARYVPYSLWRQLRDIFPMAFLAVGTGAIVYIVNSYWNINIFVSVLLYGFLYALIVLIFKFEVRKDLVRIMQILRKK